MIIRTRQLQKTYRVGIERIHALRGADIDVQENEFVAVMGSSGSGKSTLMNLLGCLDRPTSGSYFLGGVDVSQLDDDQLSDIRGRGIGFVFQTFNLVPQLTLLENLEVPLFYQGRPSHVRREMARKLADLVGLADRGHHRPSELSGGQQQRAAIARALINDPLLVLADEPTGNLDSASGEVILGIFDKLHDEGKTVVIVTHASEVAGHCNRVITLCDGRVVDDVRRQRRSAASAEAARFELFT